MRKLTSHNRGVRVVQWLERLDKPVKYIAGFESLCAYVLSCPLRCLLFLLSDDFDVVQFFLHVVGFLLCFVCLFVFGHLFIYLRQFI